ncbi:MAG: hypothetical protein ACKV22_11805 [Bryobacteraceae bacterium]
MRKLDIRSEAGSTNLPMAILFGAVIALLAANVYLYTKIDEVRGDVTKLQDSIIREISSLREATASTSTRSLKSMDALKTEIEQTRSQAAVAASVAKSEALSKVDQVARKISEEHRQAQQQVKTEISEVKQVASAANTKIQEVDTNVAAVKTEVQSTKTELDKTIAELKTVRGDMGIQSGLIATNGKELSALKRLGERNYFEFNLAKSKTPQKVGDVTLLLKKADPKKNRYTVEVMADDKKTEKKDKTINEPIQFYTSKAKQPYEIVVNQVKKDLIVGYLATPKEQITRN